MSLLVLFSVELYNMMSFADSQKSTGQIPENMPQYSNTLPRHLGGKTIRKVLHGPFSSDTFTIRKAVFPGPTKAWLREYKRQIRELALAYWLGSENDIAIISLPDNQNNGASVTRIYHQYNRITDRMMRILFDFWWDDLSCTHVREGNVNLLWLIGCLLTHYNGVFIDNSGANVCCLFHVVPIAKNVPDILRLNDEDTCMDYRKEDYYLKHLNGTHLTNDDYTKSMIVSLPGMRLTPDDN